MDLGDPGTASGPLDLFCARLKRLQAQSGVKQADLLDTAGLKRSQVSAILNGKIERPPDWGVTIAIIRACLKHAKAASRLVPPDLSDEADWQRRYFDLEQDLDTGARVKPRRDETTGRPLAEVTDPFAMEVHHPVQPDGPQPGLPALPTYVAREHDTELGRVVAAAARADSRIVVLVGGSSTGKTRACWEALELLREQDRPWRLWHPIDPGRPEAALRELPSVGPRTVVWLNEAQFYLDTADGGTGEQVAAGLRELLRDPGRAPVLVLATLWPRYWDTLTSRPANGRTDAHAQARELLSGRDISVPAAFTEDQARQLTRFADPRLAMAAQARDGQVAQFLAGAPELLARYHNAPPEAAALITTAMDARRLGMRVALPLAFLQAAAPGYLTEDQWDGLGEDWLEMVLEYTAATCKGTRGPLTRIRPLPALDSAPDAGVTYRLADDLDQHGRQARRAIFPPARFWAAAARFATSSDLAALARAAEARGLLRDAARLRKRAAAHGDTHAAADLVERMHTLHPADNQAAMWAVAHASLDHPDAVARLLQELRKAGAADQAAALLARNPAAHASLDHPYAVARLLQELREAGAADQAAALLARNPAAHASLDHPYAVAELVQELREAGAADQAAALAARAAAHTSLDNPGAVARLLQELREAGAADQAAALLARNPAAHANLDNSHAVSGLLKDLWAAGAADQAAALAARAAAHASLDNPGAVVRLLQELLKAGAADQPAHASLDHPGDVIWLLRVLREACAADQAAVLVARAAAHANLDNPYAVAQLLRELRHAGAAADHVAALLARDPAAHASLDDPWAVIQLVQALWNVGATDQAMALSARAAAHINLDNPGAVADLLEELRDAELFASLLEELQAADAAVDQVAALLARDPAAHASLGDPWAVAELLQELREAGAADQVAALLARDPAAHASLNHLGAVARLLREMREAGAADQVAALLARDPAAHASLGDPWAVARLLREMREAGAADQVAALLARDPAAHASLDHPGAVGELLHELREAGAADQAAALAARAAAYASLDNPIHVIWLLQVLQRAGAADQATALATRAAAHASLDQPSAVGELLQGLREADAADQAAALAERLPGEGQFDFFRHIVERRQSYEFGRDPDGSAASRWSWSDL